MALMRDVLARFAVLVDDSKLTKLDKKIAKVKENVKKFAMYTAAGFVVAGAAAYKFVTAASDAAETLNVLNKTFGVNAQGVLDWSKTMGKEMGRSQYSLQEYASKFGAFLEPQFKGTDQDIAYMSKRLAELGVDLASFYNTSDEEANMRLFSGLSGETEAVRRLGIDISDTSLTDFNHKRGDQRNMAQLNLQEKTLLRFEKILADTQTKWGDAKDTANEFANSLRRVQDKLKDLSVRLGNLLYGPAKKSLAWVEGAVDGFEKLTFNTSAWQAAFTTASVVGLAYGAKWLLLHKDLVKWADLLNKQFWVMNAKVLAIAGAFLILEDLWTFMRGGKSVFGDFLTIMTGVQRPLDLVNRSFEKMAMHLHNAYIYLREIGKNISFVGKVMRGDVLGAVREGGPSWDTSDLLTETKSDAQGRTRETDKDAAVVAGDKDRYIAANEGSGLSDQEIDGQWSRDRKTALRSKRAMANDMDLGSGLVEAPAFATMSNANRTKYLGGAANDAEAKRVVNITVNGGDLEAVKRTVKEALDEDKRQTAAEVAELAPSDEYTLTPGGL